MTLDLGSLMPRKRIAPLLRVTAERERPQWGDDDFDPNVEDNGDLRVSVERVDGLVEIQKHFCPVELAVDRSEEEWAEEFFRECPDELVPREIDLENVRFLIVTGKMWASRDYWGEYDVGFRLESVEKVVYDEPRYLIVGHGDRYAYDVTGEECEDARKGKISIFDVWSKTVLHGGPEWRPVEGAVTWRK